MRGNTIAVVDDDQHIRELIEAYLRRENYLTVPLSSAEEALILLKSSPPDMWILDIMLPGMDGYEFCARIRHEAEVPIILISARDTEIDKVMGLEIGGDDYLVKPFSPRELVARVNRQFQRWDRLRGQDSRASETIPAATLTVGELQLIVDQRRAFWSGVEVDLTSKEFDMLKTLAQHPNRSFSRQELLMLVWGEDYFGSDRATDHLIKRVRKKMVDIPIEAVWGHGYRLRLSGGES